MGPIRRWIMLKLGATGAGVIAVGSHVSAKSGRQTVAITLAEGWKRANCQLSPDGARRIARQLTEWADACDEHNRTLTSTEWKYVLKAAMLDGATKQTDEPPPVAQGV